MEKNSQPILVPWDFSQISGYALEHAVKFANIVNCEITLVHIIKSEKETDKAYEKLKMLADDTEKRYKIRPDVIVKEGSIFKTINETTEEVDAFLVIMGTHGMKGMQKFTGSWALKVIAGSPAPFVVVQAPPNERNYKTVVFPIDFKLENKEKLRWANYLSKLYGSKLEICTPVVTDALLKKKTAGNLQFAKRFLDEKNIDYEITNIAGKGNFAEETIDFAKEKEADMILIMTTKSISFQDYVLGAHEQQIIANRERIPVMCVNPKTNLSKYGSFTTY